MAHSSEVMGAEASQRERDEVARIKLEIGRVRSVAAPTSSSAKDSENLCLKDWAECRETIGRLDSILVDLRKLSFSFITVLLTAGAAFGGLLGAQAGPKGSAAVFITIMVLIAALFSIDTYYQVLLSGATQRALDIEVQTKPPQTLRVTKYLSDNSTHTGISYTILGLYLGLLVVAEGLGLAAIDGLGIPLWLTVNPSLGWVWATLILAGIIVVPAAIARYDERTRPLRDGPDGVHDWEAEHRLLIRGSVGMCITTAIASVLLSGAIAVLAGPKASSALPWFVVGAGWALAMYIEFYWIIAAWQSRLHREKPRNWPSEGDCSQ